MRAFFVTAVLCVIALMGSACSRHTSRALRMPREAAGLSAQNRGPLRGDPAKSVRDAIRSLKDRANRGRADDTAIAGGGSVTVTPPSPGSPSAPQSVGTSGSLSVESRYPAATPGGTTQPPTPGRGHLLSRAGAAVRGASHSSWLGVALLVVAGLVVGALVMRRHRTEA